MSGSPLPVGLVGCGSWGRHILRDLVTLGAVVTVVERSPEIRAAAGAGGAAAVVARVEDLAVVAGVVVATPTVTHAEVAAEALAHGVPIFVEKPLTADPVEAQQLAAAAPDRLFVMDKWRYHPGIELLGEIARSGELGPLLGLRTTRVGWGNPQRDVDPVWTLAPHDLSIALEVMGAIPEPRAAVADRSSGQPAGLSAQLGVNPWLTIETGTRSVVCTRQAVLYCRDGVACLPDAYSPHVIVARNGRPSAPAPEVLELRGIPEELPLLRELRAFLAHLGGGPPPRSSAAEGAHVVATVARLRKLAGLDADL